MDAIRYFTEMLERLQYQQSYLMQAFTDRLTDDYQLGEMPEVLTNWPNMTYDEFKAELDLVLAKQLISSCTVRDWFEYFHMMQQKALKLRKDIADTQTDLEKHRNNGNTHA